MTTDLDAPSNGEVSTNYSFAGPREGALKNGGQVNDPTTKQGTTASLMHHLLTTFLAK